MDICKPTIFIGSSAESEPFARLIQGELLDIADCKLWTKQFDFGESAYEDLLNKLSLYDYGILVASADDKVASRGVSKWGPRDNIIFEFGLFAGRLGRRRSFLFVEAGIKIPSDLLGITMPFFKSSKSSWWMSAAKKKELSLQQTASIKTKCSELKAYIGKRNGIFDYGFLPSTALAYGYFHNFILKSVGNLLESKVLKIVADASGDVILRKFQEIKFSILIPDDLRADMFEKVKEIRRSSNWILAKVDAGGFRPFDFYVQMDDAESTTIFLSDIPITLNALNDAVRSYVGKAYVGIGEAENLLEKRELCNFKQVLDYLISANPSTKNRVRTEVVDI